MSITDLLLQANQNNTTSHKNSFSGSQATVIKSKKVNKSANNKICESVGFLYFANAGY